MDNKNTAQLEPERHQGRKVQIWADPAERDRWEAAAGDEGMSLSAWVRRAANRAVEVESRVQRVREVLE